MRTQSPGLEPTLEWSELPDSPALDQTRPHSSSSCNVQSHHTASSIHPKLSSTHSSLILIFAALMLPRRMTIACLLLAIASLRTPSTAQPIGDRVGDTCRMIAIDPTHDAAELTLYARPILTPDLPQRSPDYTPQPSPHSIRSTHTAQPTQTQNNAITLLFDREQVALLNANQSGVDGDVHLWHEIEDSIGNRGYLLAIDPETQRSTLSNCP
jgi:hypothetical protein